MGHARKRTLTLFITTRCNLKCIYCYAQKLKIEEEHQNIDLNFAKKGIDDFFKDNPDPSLRFYGIGEPTLEFEKMKEIVNYARSITDKKVTTELQTNGFFTEKVRDWVIENIDILWISCDGPGNIMEKQRPVKNGIGNAATVIEKNISFFACHSDKIQFGVRATLTEDTLNRQVELVDYFNSLGIKNISVEAYSPSIESDLESYAISPIEFATHFVEAYKYAMSLGISYLSLTMINFDEEVDCPCRSGIPCPQLTTDGYVSCCDYGALGPQYLPGVLQNFIYGKYDPNTNTIHYDEEKIRNIKSRQHKLPETACKNCQIFNHCGGGCMGEAVNVSGNLFGIREYSCEVTKLLWSGLPKMEKLFAILHS